MKKIDKYVNSIYKDVAGDKQELEDLKQEMRSHLAEAVEELKAKGKTEDEAIRIAIDNFGGRSEIVKGLSEFFKVQKKFKNYVFSFALIFLALGIFFLFTSVKEFNKEAQNLEVVEQERVAIMNDVFDIIDATNEVTQKEIEQLLVVFKKYHEQLNVLAVFPTTGSEDWLGDNIVVKKEPTTRFPIKYSNAAIVIGNGDVIGDKEQIIPSDYDLGTVIMANEQWIVQYEYKSSYENTIEMSHQFKYYSPIIRSFYQLPILFFALFSVLGVVWLFLTKHTRQLKGVMN
ncbi:hypothetical protein GN156_17965 [bacterium LRH843]|nr:hypothetical protein [bacterium LRH843]